MCLWEWPGQCDACKEVLVQTDHVKQNSFHPMSDNREIQIIWHLRRVVHRPEVYFIPERKKTSLMKQEKKSGINDKGISEGHVFFLGVPSPLCILQVIRQIHIEWQSKHNYVYVIYRVYIQTSQPTTCFGLFQLGHLQVGHKGQRKYPIMQNYH